MSVQKKPYLIDVFRGEKRLLIIPSIRHEGGFSVDSEWCVNIPEEDSNSEKVGSGVINAIKVIDDSPISTSTPKEREESAAWRKNSKYKGWGAFWKNNDCVRVRYHENGHYEIYSMIKSRSRVGVYSEIAKTIMLSNESCENDVGNAVLEVFEALDKYYNANGKQRVSLYKSIELLNNSKILITPPKDKHLQDDGDSSAAEIYQCYSYHFTEEAESSAEIFLGIAPELDCNLKSNNIRSSWEDIHGKADNFEVQEENCGIFILRAEMKNKEIHKISYFLQQEEDLLLECSMEVHNPNKRKKLDVKMVQMFEEFAIGCKL